MAHVKCKTQVSFVFQIVAFWKSHCLLKRQAISYSLTVRVLPRLVTGMIIILHTCLPFALPADDYLPIQLPSTRSTYPLFSRYIQIPAFSANLVGAGELLLAPSFCVSQSWTNGEEINTAGKTVWNIQSDYESTSFGLPILYGLDNQSSIGLDLQINHYGGGIFDSAIESWHAAFDFPNAFRELFPRNSVDIDMRTKQGVLITKTEAFTSFADPQLYFGHRLVTLNQPKLAISLLASQSLPLGLAANVNGNPWPQTAVFLLAGLQSDPAFYQYLHTGLVLPWDSLGFADTQPRPLFQARSGFVWRLFEGFGVYADISFKTSPFSGFYLRDNTSDGFATPQADFFFGFTLLPNQHSMYSISMQEDPVSHNASDISIMFDSAFRLKLQ